MSVIRQDPITKEWVNLANERGKRPDNFQKVLQNKLSPEYEATCPFCPYNEGMIPPELMRIPNSAFIPWTIRVIPNKFAALQGEGQPVRREASIFFREMDGSGYCQLNVLQMKWDAFTER